MMRLPQEVTAVLPTALVGIAALVFYLRLRGRRLGRWDLIGFIVLAVVFDALAVATYRQIHGNDWGNLIVMAALLFLVPAGALFSLGAVVIALRIAHIGMTGGSLGVAPGKPASTRRPIHRDEFKRTWIPAAAAVLCLSYAVVHRSVLWFVYALVAAAVALIWWWMLRSRS